MRPLAICAALLLALMGRLVAAPAPAPPPTCARFMPDGTLLIADEGGGLQRVGRFPADRGVRIDAGRGAVTAIVPSPDGRWVALTCKRGASIREGATLNELGFVSIKHSARLAFRSDGTLLALSGVSEGGDCPRRLTAWRVGPQGVGAARTVPTPCAVVCLSGDGRFMLGQVPRSSPEALTVWALDASIRAVRVSRLVTDARNGHFGTLFLSGDGHHLVSLDAPLNPYPESYPRLYDTRKGKLLRLFDSNAGVSGGLAAIAPKATLLVTSGYFPDPVCYWVFGYRPHRDAVVWEATGFGRPSEGAAESAPDPSTAPIRSLDVSADGERVAVVTSLGVFVLDAGTGKLVWQPR